MIRIKRAPLLFVSRFQAPHIINNAANVQQKSFSLQSSVESLIKTQHGIFQAISESAPVAGLQQFLISYHEISGLPWWFTIISTTFMLRTCVTLPLAVYQNYITAKVQNAQLELAELAKELRHEVAIATRMYKWDEKSARHHFRYSLKKQWKRLIEENNCHPVKGSLLIWFQIPMWISFSVALRNLVYMLPTADPTAQIAFMELSVGGFGFIQNLAAADATFILPIMLGITNLAIIEIQDLAKTGERTKLQKGALHFFRGFSILMIPIAASVPSCVALYWTASSTYGLMQNLILFSPKLRRLCRIPTTPKDLDKPYFHIFSQAKRKLGVLPGS